MEPYVQRKTRSAVRLGKEGQPVRRVLDIELTERCNNNCAHCCINLPADDESAMARELSTEEFTGILREAASLSHLAVRFTGGEPLLRNDFVDLYLTARQLGMDVLLFTNATLITP
ncbi:MAG: radical SAM protein, partial [Anaerolineae bacterium]|nr:radical SAM protein [Anaerolineae bacterium]NIN93448.1 radical SAM protein [Anaerolineae bacterium]NIQ76548.1 radical SAM protein [Anaerolineae bacterium]